MTGKYGFENSDHITGGHPSLSTLIWFPAFSSRKMLYSVIFSGQLSGFDGAGCLLCSKFGNRCGGLGGSWLSSSVEAPWAQAVDFWVLI